MTQVNAVLRKTDNWRKIFHDAYIFLIRLYICTYICLFIRLYIYIDYGLSISSKLTNK